MPLDRPEREKYISAYAVQRVTIPRSVRSGAVAAPAVLCKRIGPALAFRGCVRSCVGAAGCA